MPRPKKSRLRRVLVGVLAFCVGLIGGGGAIGCCVFSAPGHSGPATDHFDGEKFSNQVPVEHAGFCEFLGWQLTAEPGAWEDVSDAKPGQKPPARVGKGELRITFVGHATTLVQMDGKNVLTDPIWSERASPVSFAGPKRVRPPGIRFEDLPSIDAVVVSHSHYDHLDMPTLKRLHAAHRPRFFVGLGNRQLLEADGIDRVTELDWWEHVDLGDGVVVHSVPAQHFSGRGLCDRDVTLWMGYVLRGPGGVVYFAGDTAMGPHFEQVRQRFGAPRLAILPIGAYLPRWFMQRVHVSPAEAVEAHQILGAEQSVAVHFGTFNLGDDGQQQAPEELREALRKRGVDAASFWVLGFGEGRPIRRK
ncbi:MAG TPA: MBL fold metallo-hydrolase [Polyangiaceae bacterium]|nr:MBL fold metallo-hydrolase [Polyangiaceae bacterium]